VLDEDLDITGPRVVAPSAQEGAQLSLCLHKGIFPGGGTFVPGRIWPMWIRRVPGSTES
jgi:hypothetical protein